EIPMIAVSSHDYNLIYFTNWGGSGYRKSTDQGVTWNLILATGGTWGTDLAKDDPTVPGFGIYGGTNNGYVSTNSGSNFAVSTIGGSVNYGMLFYDRGTLLAQQSGGMYKLTVNYTVPTITSNNQISSEIPKEFALFQNYPNPFNPETQIEYNVSKTSLVEIKIYNVVGSELKSIVNRELSPGKYSVNLNASGYGSGVYFYSLLINGQKIDTKRMMLVK
ncbi:MAG: T9SS type A sorting domain-containing protein, partial [Ignavibacteria bacterium]